MAFRFGLIGTGKIAHESLAPALSAAPDACLWSVLSRERARADDFARAHGARAARAGFDDLDAMLADPDLDGVLIATPDKLHATQALAAARAGKHVLTEKPMATEQGDADAMVEACSRAGVTLGVAYHMRWHAGHRRLAQRVHAGELGEIRHMRVLWARKHASDDNWRATHALGRWWSLAGVGTHCIDQVRWLMMPSCGEVTRVRSVINNGVWGSEHDETAVVALQFENGATAEVCTSVLFDAPRRMEVYGTRGHALCDGTLGPSGTGSIVTDDGPLAFEPADPYVGEIADFVAAVRDAREPEVCGREGARNVAILLQAIEPD